MALRPGFALRVVEIGSSDRVQGQGLVGCQQRGHARADRKTRGRDADGRGKQFGPSQAAMLLVCQCQHADHARNANRPPADHGLLKGHGCALGIQKQRGPRSRGCGFAAVKSLGFFAIKMQQKSPAAYAAALGLDHAQHHLHGNRRVDRAAACAQDLVARLGGQRVGCSNRKSACRKNGFFDTCAGQLGLCGRTDLRLGAAPAATQCQGQHGGAGCQPQPGALAGMQAGVHARRAAAQGHGRPIWL